MYDFIRWLFRSLVLSTNVCWECWPAAEPLGCRAERVRGPELSMEFPMPASAARPTHLDGGGRSRSVSKCLPPWEGLCEEIKRFGLENAK